MNLVDHALQYAGRGWRVFPIKPRAKTPLVKKGFHAATTDAAAIERWWAKWPDANIGIATGAGLMVVDIDGAEGIASAKAQFGILPSTLICRTARGVHAYYAVRGKVPCSSGGGLDVRGDGGYVLAPPSVHPSGTVYRWENQCGLAAGDQVETWARERKGARPVASGLDFGPRPDWLGEPGGFAEHLARTLGEPADAEDVRAALTVIPNADLGWDAWKRILMAVWAATKGSEDGRAAGEAWSRKSRKYTPEGFDAAWREVSGCPPDSIGFGSLVFEARQAVPGWEPPSRAAREVPPSAGENFDPNLLQVNGKHALPSQLTQEDQSNPLIRLNKDYAVIGNVGGKCLVLSWVASNVDEAVKVPCFQSFKSFSERYANRYVTVGAGDKTEAKQMGAYWLKWPARRSFEGIDLVPGAPEVLGNGYLNLWQGFAVRPAGPAIGWERMKRHIFEILASKDAELARYIFRFAAWAVQHPGERAEVALVFRGGKGSGKGTFANALRALFGQHGLQIFNSKHLVGAFNGHLRNCLLLFADEAFWAGDKQGESVLKGLITERELFIEHKGVDAVPWRNRLHVIMAANAEWAVPASHDERRYVVCDVAGDRIGDRAYFKALHQEVQSRGLGAMLRDLLACELGDWHPRDVIQTAGLRKQKEMSLNPLAAWWEDFLQTGVLPSAMAGGEARRISSSTLLYQAKESAGRNSVNATQLGRFLREQSCVKIHQRDGNGWEIPELKSLRDNWERKFGNWEWRGKSEVWAS